MFLSFRDDISTPYLLVSLIVLPTILFGWELPNTYQLFLLALMGIFGGIAQILATNAY